jgi:S-adenosylmethionine-dependent methyltransferase
MNDRLRMALERRRALGRDADFDHMRGFDDGLYGTSFGELRLAVVVHDLLERIPELRDGGLTVLDAGGGAGHLAIRLAQLGNDVVLCDPSLAMLVRARAAVEEAGLGDAITLVQAPIQEQHKIVPRTFDLITCHAVLNWLADPEDALARLAESLAQRGRLSLMFGNRNSWVLRRALRGDFTGVLSDPDRDSMRALHGRRMKGRRLSRLPAGWSELGWGKHGVPLSEATVRDWLARLGFAVESKAGIRMFHDHLPEPLRGPERFDELLELEIAFRNIEPFASLGRLIHLVCSREPVYDGSSRHEGARAGLQQALPG